MGRHAVPVYLYTDDYVIYSYVCVILAPLSSHFCSICFIVCKWAKLYSGYSRSPRQPQLNKYISNQKNLYQRKFVETFKDAQHVCVPIKHAGVQLLVEYILSHLALILQLSSYVAQWLPLEYSWMTTHQDRMSLYSDFCMADLYIFLFL